MSRLAIADTGFVVAVANRQDNAPDSRLDFVDATVIAIAERLNITRILTIDKRDFGMVRPTHADAFDLLP